MTAGSADFGVQGEIEFQARLYAHPNPTRRGLHLGRRAWVEAMLSELLTPESVALEVGVGCGIFVRFMAQRAARVHAIDINAAFLDGVADTARVVTHQADATRPLPVEPVDVALCTEVLEHVPPQRSLAMLRALHDTLKPGGHLVLTTPQSFATVELMARLFRFPPVLALARRLYGTAEELGHINLLTAPALRRQLQDAGFEIVAHRRFGFYLPVIAEFGGAAGWGLLRGLENAIRPLPLLRGLLWTQAYLLRRPT